MHSEAEIVYDKQGNAYEVVDFNDDYKGAKMGFWLFMFTEVMLFATMFLVYAFYMFVHPEAFQEASGTLNLYLGGTNTVILLVSALTMGLSLVSMRSGDVAKSKRYIWITIALALVFLAIKYVEWSTEIHHGIYPGSEVLADMGAGKVMFFGLYFVITGLHGLHIIFGIGAMLWVLNFIKNKKVTPQDSIVLENTALYWDLVHLVWVFVFPLFYLVY